MTLTGYLFQGLLEQNIAQWIHHEGLMQQTSKEERSCFVGGGGGGRERTIYMPISDYHKTKENCLHVMFYFILTKQKVLLLSNVITSWRHASTVCTL